MDAQDHDERESDHNDICRLEWIALAIEAARRHKDSELPAPTPTPTPPRRVIQLDAVREKK